MKNAITNPSSGVRNALKLRFRQLAMMFVILTMIRQPLHAQVLGLWNFNGNNTGVAGIYNQLTPADFSPGIPSRAYNPTVYYGEDGWPAGALNPSAYFEFGLAPLVGNSLNMSNISMTIRRSSTGTPSGSGPTRWSLRSSLDGYTTDLSSGALTPAAVTFNISPGSSFVSLLLGVRFRLYGYQTTISSGGNSRLVMENLQLTGIGTILPVRILNFSAMLRGNQVQVKYGITNHESGNRYIIERSADATNFSVVDENNDATEQFDYTHTDKIQGPATTLYYRLKIVTGTGAVIYSSVAVVHVTDQDKQALLIMQRGNTIRVTSSLKGSLVLDLITSSGQVVLRKQVTGNSAGIELQLPPHSSGIYHLTIANGETKQSGSMYLQ